MGTPIIISLKDDLHDVCEFSGSGKFLYTFFTVIRDEVVYFGRVAERKDKITVEQVNAALTPVPDNELFPKSPAYSSQPFTVAPDTLPETNLYVKRPRFSMYDIYREEDIFSVLPSLIVDEARAMERISRRPHPNVIKYYGCRVRRGRITGLVFEKHPADLESYVKDRQGRVDRESFMAGVESAVNHLHKLGYAHNDLNPSNILVAQDGRPIVVDFGSSKRIGAKLTTSRGTPGWMEEGDAYHTSEKSHDLFAIGKIRGWLYENQI